MLRHRLTRIRPPESSARTIAWTSVFNVGGNKYRLVVDIRYDLGRVYVRAVLTHEEYDRKSIEGAL